MNSQNEEPIRMEFEAVNEYGEGFVFIQRKPVMYLKGCRYSPAEDKYKTFDAYEVSLAPWLERQQAQLHLIVRDVSRINAASIAIGRYCLDIGKVKESWDGEYDGNYRITWDSPVVTFG